MMKAETAPVDLVTIPIDLVTASDLQVGDMIAVWLKPWRGVIARLARRDPFTLLCEVER